MHIGRTGPPAVLSISRKFATRGRPGPVRSGRWSSTTRARTVPTSSAPLEFLNPPRAGPCHTMHRPARTLSRNAPPCPCAPPRALDSPVLPAGPRPRALLHACTMHLVATVRRRWIDDQTVREHAMQIAITIYWSSLFFFHVQVKQGYCGG